MDDEPGELELPRGVALAWGIAANPQRGPKRELSLERIVEAAVEIADADGLGAVSMSSVAARLGFTTMSLYRYVSAKDDLILLMQEYGTGVPGPALDGETWREALARWSRESQAHYDAHPWLIDIPITGTPNTPNMLAWMDAALAAFRDSPLDAGERMGALLLVTGQARFRATVNRGYDSTNTRLGMTPEERDRAEELIMTTLVRPEQFPDLYEAVADGFVTSPVDPFAFGLERVLDGIESYISAKEAGSAPEPAEHHDPGIDAAVAKDPAVRLARQTRRDLETKLREAQRKEREVAQKAVERYAKEAEKATNRRT